jgi:hypothetical protein
MTSGEINVGRLLATPEKCDCQYGANDPMGGWYDFIRAPRAWRVGNPGPVV